MRHDVVACRRSYQTSHGALGAPATEVAFRLKCLRDVEVLNEFEEVNKPR